MNMPSPMPSIIGRLLIGLIPLVIFGGILALIIYRKTHKIKRSKAEIVILWCIRGLIIGFFVFGAWEMGVSVYHAIGRSRVNNANEQARLTAETFTAAVEALEQREALPDHCEMCYTGRSGDPADEGSIAQEMNRYHADGMYYAVVTDGDWRVRYALWSKKPIAAEDIRPYAYSEQTALMFRPFANTSALIGYYEQKEPAQISGS